MMVAEGLRGTNDNGENYWKRGTLITSAGDNSSSWGKRMREAGVVLDWVPELSDQIVLGEVTLDTAYKQAVEARDRVDAEKRAKAIEANLSDDDTLNRSRRGRGRCAIIAQVC